MILLIQFDKFRLTTYAYMLLTKMIEFTLEYKCQNLSV